MVNRVLILMQIIRKNFLYRKLCLGARNLLLVATLTGLVLSFTPQNAEAITQCASAVAYIKKKHGKGREDIKKHINKEFSAHEDWIINTFFIKHILPAMMRMTEQLSAVGMQQVMAIGMFLDAKTQLETQRLLQELQVQAHKDYQPSEDFCWFGTNVRSMAASEQIGRHNALALNARQMTRHLKKHNSSGAVAADSEKLSRWRQFQKIYCDPHDNNWNAAVVAQTGDSGLSSICGSNSGGERTNIDIDYTRLIDEKRTLDIAFTDKEKATSDEEDVLALSNNLYGHNVLASSLSKKRLGTIQYQHDYLTLRSVMAKRSIAENSFNAIVGMKSSGSSDKDTGSASKTREFLGAILKEVGVPDDEIYELIGKQPSYYAQLEILAKRIYQNPDFYSNLYDKPANVKRKGVALKAIELMLDRAIFESQLRQEMAMSVLLSSRLRPVFRNVNKDL